MAEPLPDRETALNTFNRAREGLETAYASVPDDALRYLPPGDDYTLGGLAAHVTDTLLGYGGVLNQMVSAGFGEVHTSDANDAAKQRRDRLVREGFGPDERPGVFQEMSQAHEAVASQVRALNPADFSRAAPVYFGDAQEPYQTRAGDLLQWLSDHYDEHTLQVAELLARWRETQAR